MQIVATCRVASGFARRLAALLELGSGPLYYCHDVVGDGGPEQGME